MKIRLNVLRKMIREELSRGGLLREASMQDPVASATSRVLSAWIADEEVIDSVDSTVGDADFDPEKAISELITVFPSTKEYRSAVEKLVGAVAQRKGKSLDARVPRYRRSRPTEDGEFPDNRRTVVPPRPQG